MLGLVDGVLDTFQPDLMAFAPDMAGTVAGRPDMGIAGAGVLIHHDAVGAGQPSRHRQLVARHHADADQHDIGVISLAARDDALDLAVAFEGFHAGLQHQLHAGLFMLARIEVGQHRRHGAGHQPVHRLEHRHVQPALGADRRHFQPDIAAANNGDALAGLEHGLQPVHVRDGLEIMHTGQIGAGTAQLAHPRAGRQQQLFIGQLASVIQFHHALGTVDRLGAGVQDQFAAGLGVISVGLEKQAGPLEGAQQIGLGQRRALIGRIGFVAHHGDGTGEAFLAQRFHGLDASLSGADDDDFFGHFFA